ncbi:hypothetical protein ACGFOU_34345 [Streptomyces sp. NPDC048595]|uniref:hypothetical protein n=1 Tax=Streptomyces sp. NPDC048595 TaxID=3365576 RepID=UPI003724471A
MAALDKWDRGPSPGRTQRMAHIMQALHTAWLAPHGITAHLTHNGTTLTLTTPQATHLHTAATPADTPTPLMHLTSPTEIRITPTAHHGQHTQLWEVLTQLHNAATTHTTQTTQPPTVPYNPHPHQHPDTQGR